MGFGPMISFVTGRRGLRAPLTNRKIGWHSEIRTHTVSGNSRASYRLDHMPIEIWWSVKDSNLRRSQGPVVLQTTAIAATRTLQNFTEQNLNSELTSPDDQLVRSDWTEHRK